MPAYPWFVQFYDISKDPGMTTLVEMLQRLSGARTAQDVFVAFMERYWKLRPVTHFFGVIPDASGAGRYRIVYHVAAECLREGWAVPARNPSPEDFDKLEVHEGGIIGRLISEPRPSMVHDLDVEGDPVLSEYTGSRRCMALPVFAGDYVAEWVVALSDQVQPLEPKDFHHALLTSNFMGMANSHLSSMEEIQRLNARMTAQFEEVARIQQALLPNRIPSIPGLKIATSYLTSDHAGGDYYDFFPLPDGRWGIMIADVSGHGAGAATVMAMLHAILHCYTGSDVGPDVILRYANQKLLDARIEGNFVTAFLGIYDPERATLCYASGGHNPPRFKVGAGGAVRGIDDATSFPLGIFEPYELEAGCLSLGTHDTIVLYTDGITEAFNEQREMFGVERLDAALTGCSGDPDCVIDSVHTALYAHSRSRTRADDQTLVAIRYVGRTEHPVVEAARAFAGTAAR